VTSLPTSGRIGPAANSDTQFFWDGTRAGRLLIQRCSDCQALRHPPGPACPHCHSLQWDTVEASGRGTLYSWTALHRPPALGFVDGPAVAVVVELAEGVRLISNIADAEIDTLRIGEPLEVFFLEQDEGWTAPQFRRPAR
jgi:uncharacterized OB-fold protein